MSGMAVDSVFESALRLQIIDWVMERFEQQGYLRWAELVDFSVNGARLQLIDRGRGIRNPENFASTLSIMASRDGPYSDVITPDGLLRYAYQGDDPDGGDNPKLRNALIARAPIILFQKVARGVYVPTAPVYVVGDDRASRTFLVALDESLTVMSDSESMTIVQKEYAYRVARQRLHQPAFRSQVLRAYESHCAVCRLRYGVLLDAAHILADSDQRGVPTTDNGMALCKIHHVAYDRDMLGITPDYVVKVSPQVLQDSDGPMLTHGLQEMHGRELVVPKRAADRPNRDYLAERFEGFSRAS